MAVEVHGIQHRFDAGAEGTSQEGDAPRAHAARRSRAREVGQAQAQIPLKNAVQMTKAVVQPGSHIVVRALLGTEHPCCAVGAAEGILHVAHDGDTDVFQQAAAFRGINMGDVRQRTAHRNKGISLRIVEAGAQGRGTAAAAVVGGAAAQAQQDIRAALLHRVPDKLAHAVGGGGLWVPPLPRQRQSGGGGHFDDGKRVFSGVDRLNCLPEGVGDGDCHRLGLESLQKTGHSAFSSIGHREGHQLAVREMGRDHLPGDGTDVQGGQSPLERIRDHDTFFHGDALLAADGNSIPCPRFQRKKIGPVRPDF